MMKGRALRHSGLAGKRRRTARLATLLLVSAAVLFVAGAAAQGDDPLDPARDVALPCEAVGAASVPRSAHNIVHLANRCGFVSTDVEFESRKDASGKVHDYAFLGTMGAGMRIFDVTTPANPTPAGAYADPGWEGDIQVRGDIGVIGFDPISGRPLTTSACLLLKSPAPTVVSGGIDIIRLDFDPVTAKFSPILLDCVPNLPGGGAHNSTLHPSGRWLALSNPRANGSIDVVDLTGSTPRFTYRIVQNGSLTSSACTGLANQNPAPAPRCISNGRPGTWSPHDVHFSRDGNTMYVAAVGNDTVIVNVTNVLSGSVSTIGVAPNDSQPLGDVATNSQDVDISHQSDVTADEKLLVVTDERGGGLTNTDCNGNPSGVIGGMHFWALAPLAGVAQSTGASPSAPKRIGGWFYPNPTLGTDAIGRAERACTIHVFRLGGNGTSSPGQIQAGFEGVSSLPTRQTVSAHYGAGVWYIDFSGPPTSADGTVEDSRTSWGNTLGWSVMPGAETWSAKEYKGFIYAGDMGRGFDVYGFTRCDGPTCLGAVPNTPGKATGGGQIDGSLAETTILRGNAAGGRANFGFNAQFTSGLPTGHLTYIDHASSTKLQSTAIETFTIDPTGKTATFTGTATVNGTPTEFTVTVEDMGEPGNADMFTITWPGYLTSGVLVKGNIQVRPG